MARIDDLKAALVKADAAGDTEAARIFAAEIRKTMTKAPIVDNLNAETLDPTKGTSMGQRLLEGIGSGLNSVKQAVTFAPKAEVEETKRLDAPLMKTGAGTVGNIIGNVAAAAPAAFIPGANTVLGAGAIGAGVGALTTPGDMSDRGTGAALGGAGGAIGQAIPRAFSVLRAGAEPFSQGGREAIVGRVMNRAAGDSAADVVSRLKGATELVPGSAPTAAEVAESGGIAALQRAMSQADPEAYAHRGMQQSAARIQALRDIAKDDVTRNAAVAARDAATKPLYDAAKLSNVPVDPQLQSILDRVPVSALQKAAEIARIEGKNGPLPLGTQLHYVKMALDASLDPVAANAVSKTEKAAVTGLKSDLLNWMDNAIPEYGQARKAFAAASRPINQMDIGSALLNKLQGPLADYGALANETGATLARALRGEGETLARNATGFRQGIGDVLDQGQMASVNAVAQDLARKANAQNLGRGVGSNTFQNFAMDNLAQQGGMPSAVKALAGWVPGMTPLTTLATKAGGAAIGAAYKNSDEAMRHMMAQALLNPQQAATLMEAAGKPALMARALQALPKAVQARIPPEDVLKLMQAAPGVAGTAALPAYLEQ